MRKNGSDLQVAPAGRLTPALRIAIRTWKPALWFLADMDTPYLLKYPKPDSNGQFALLTIEETKP